MRAWSYFALAQLASIVATLVGYALLLPFCLLQAWETSPKPSIGQKAWLSRGPIDRWRWAPLNAVYGNPEDGVSGQTALVWGSGTEAGHLVSYMPTPAWLQRFTELPSRRMYGWLYAAWRAYCWSGWRNSADALKYVFAWRGAQPAPFKQVRVLGRTLAFGWKLENGIYNVPVLSYK